MPEVFISHSSNNRGLASALKEELVSQGISCWMAPDDISLGHTWEDAVADAILNASAFVILWSSSSQDSLQVKRELSLAASQKKLIIPLKLDEEVPRGAFAYYLTNTHWRQLDPSTIRQCSISIKEQIRSTVPSQFKTSRDTPVNLHKSHPQQNEVLDLDISSKKSDLDVTHNIYITSLQSKQGHTRIIKIGIGETAESLEVKVPAGIKTGARLRLKGKGNQSKALGVRGDLYLLVRIIDA